MGAAAFFEPQHPLTSDPRSWLSCQRRAPILVTGVR